MSISQRIRELRGSKTLEEFALPLDVTASNISAIEKGRLKLSMDLAIKISEAYSCSMDWLTKGVGEKGNGSVKHEDINTREIELKYMKALETLVAQKDEIISLKDQLLEKEKAEKQKAQEESQKL
ncbi:helix-turn-helix transcriptional regulator [Siphonobacter sp. SORGH_AS_0500]|uniref:helix-turn-helix domain-containing protein n=1 Tax=Siphonobacter sp. SORGH_AS_0500 TaxID=1864824 RepID=UPI002866B3D4|nr:helix-turn-helix transcriptional regulator [Siphonobacter sp. SORGH_AS_0500]MDR6194756.1 transcriptional regulator with XRE-family HTH domain [Siphonobacter sp. SORGH_AS_0500]